MRLGEWYQRAEAATSVGIGPSGLPVTEDSGNGIPTQPPAGGSCRADSFVAAGDNMLLRPSRLPMRAAGAAADSARTEGSPCCWMASSGDMLPPVHASSAGVNEPRSSLAIWRCPMPRVL